MYHTNNPSCFAAGLYTAQCKVLREGVIRPWGGGSFFGHGGTYSCGLTQFRN